MSVVSEKVDGGLSGEEKEAHRAERLQCTHVLSP